MMGCGSRTALATLPLLLASALLWHPEAILSATDTTFRPLSSPKTVAVVLQKRPFHRFRGSSNTHSSAAHLTVSSSSSTTVALTIRGGGGGSSSSRATKPKKRKSKRSSDADNDGGQSTIASSVFTLVNNVAGAGILTLSAGMAPGGGSGNTGYATAVIICAVLGLLSGHCFAIVGEACEMTDQADFKGLWKTTIGEDSAWAVDAIIAVMCLACSIIYSGILGDVFTSLLARAGFPAQYNGRTSNS